MRNAPNSLVKIFALLSVIPFVAGRIWTALDTLDNEFPPNTANIPEITGPFTITVIARFDSIAGGYYQRLIDFGNGPGDANIIFGQFKGTDKAWLKIWANDGTGKTYRLVVSDALTEGTTDTWEAGVDATGSLTIKKNGVQLGQNMGAVPLPVVRTNKLIGRSNWSPDDDFIGAILGLKVVNHNDAQDFRSMELLNLPSQIVSSRFVATCYVRLDNLDGDRYDQRIFELGNGQQDIVTFSQYLNTTDVVLEIQQDGLIHQCFTNSGTPLVLGEMALWRVQVSTSPTASYYRIEKDGVELVECIIAGGEPKSIIRQDLLIGESGFAGSTKTQGVILGLRIDDDF